MSGRWARACDEQSVGDSHRSPARSAQLALTWITHALIAIEDGEDPSLAIARAGAHVRAWRKSLPDHGEHVDCYEWPDGTLIHAGRATLTALGHPYPEYWLRAAEAALRSAWKQAAA